MFLKATHRPEQMLYFWKGYCTRTSKMKFLGVWHANTQIQMHKYKNTVSVKVCDFYSSFQGYPTCHYWSHIARWPNMAIYGHLAIGDKSVSKWQQFGSMPNLKFQTFLNKNHPILAASALKSIFPGNSQKEQTQSQSNGTSPIWGSPIRVSICVFVFVYLYLFICICVFVFVYLYLCICMLEN